MEVWGWLLLGAVVVIAVGLAYSAGRKRTGIRPHDAYSMYLAYHEGAGGYLRGTYKKKQWLKDVARKVERRAASYQRQLVGCQENLDSNWFWRSLFGSHQGPQTPHTFRG